MGSRCSSPIGLPHVPPLALELGPLPEAAPLCTHYTPKHLLSDSPRPVLPGPSPSCLPKRVGWAVSVSPGLTGPGALPAHHQCPTLYTPPSPPSSKASFPPSPVPPQCDIQPNSESAPLPPRSANPTILPEVFGPFFPEIYPTARSAPLCPLLLQSVAPSTRHLYISALAKFRQWLMAQPSTQQDISSSSVDHYLLTFTCPPQPSGARAFLAAVQFAHTVACLPTSPLLPHHWKSVSALVRIGPTPRRQWFLIDFLTPGFLSNLTTPIQPETYATALIALAFLLRISEAKSIGLPDIGTHSIRFRPAKRASTHYWRPASPFLQAWLAFLRDKAQTPGAFVPQVQLVLRSINQTPPLTWHTFRRGGAALLLHLGIHPTQLQTWGRWRSPQSAQPYVEQLSPLNPSTFITLYDPSLKPTTIPLRSLWPSMLFPTHHDETPLPSPSSTSGPATSSTSLTPSPTSTVPAGCLPHPDDPLSPPPVREPSLHAPGSGDSDLDAEPGPPPGLGLPHPTAELSSPHGSQPSGRSGASRPRKRAR